jgi:hypothetical protein
MYAANSYNIRIANDQDADALHRLAALDSKAPLEGTVLVGEIAGAPVAAISLSDDRVVADPFVPTAHVLATLRVRANGLRAFDRTPLLRERLIAALPISYRLRRASGAA